MTSNPNCTCVKCREALATARAKAAVAYPVVTNVQPVQTHMPSPWAVLGTAAKTDAVMNAAQIARLREAVYAGPFARSPWDVANLDAELARRDADGHIAIGGVATPSPRPT